MRVYVTGKIKDMTKKEVRSIVESMGHQYTSFSQNTDILILGERPGPAKIAHALTWGVKTMTWEQFLKIEEKSERNTDTDSDYVDLYCEKKRGPSTVSVLKTAEILWLDGKGFTKIDLSNTTNLPRLTRLHLANNSLTEIDLTPLEGRNELSWLLLSNNSLGSVDLNPLATCPNLEVLELASNSIEEIDLAPLSNCEHLNTLVLSGNNLTNVNLSPLEECHRLAHLILSRNKLTSIDLFPLSGSGLRDLFLDGNHLEAIDLSPLESTYLCTLNLSKNALQDIDLSPLRSCTSLGIVDFSSNRLETFDFAPFAHLQYLWHVVLCNNRIGRIDLSPVFEVWSNGYPQPSVYIDRNSLDRFGKPVLFYDDENDRGRVLLEIDDDVAVAMDSVYREELEVQQDKGFSEIRSRITLISGADLAREVYERSGWPGLKKRLLQLPRLASLGALSMAELGGLKKPLEDLLSVIPDDSSFDEGISIAYQVAVDFLREQIERGETTKNLDIEAMRETSAAVLIPRILELRRKEVESLILGPDKNGVYHIGDLYRTYYGRLLSAKFGLSLRVKLSELEPLLAAMDGLGLKLRVLSEPEEE